MAFFVIHCESRGSESNEEEYERSVVRPRLGRELYDGLDSEFVKRAVRLMRVGKRDDLKRAVRLMRVGKRSYE